MERSMPHASVGAAQAHAAIGGVLQVRTLPIAVIANLSAAGPTLADDWPQWRGPTRDAVWTEQGILKSVPAGGWKVCWRVAVGRGFSSPIVVHGRVYLTDVELSR